MRFPRWDPDGYERKLEYVFNNDITDFVFGVSDENPACLFEDLRHGRTARQVWLPRETDKILDIGCGTGALMRRLQKKLQHATIQGIDPDPKMVARAGRDFEVDQIAVENMSFESKFTRIVSNATFHWVKQPELALANCHRALQKNGYLIVEQGGVGNLAALRTAVRAQREAFGYNPEFAEPWNLPTVEEQRRWLERGKMFRVLECELVYRRTPMVVPFGDWIESLSWFWLDGIRGDETDAVKSYIKKSLDGVLIHDGEWFTDYVRLVFVAMKI